MGAALPIGVGLAGVGSLLKGIGGIREANAAGSRYNSIQNQATGLMQNGPSQYETMLMQLLGGRQAPAAYDPSTGMIDAKSILPGTNPGNDALMQFLRSDPSKQMQFDASPAFAQLQALDQRTQAGAVNALNQNFSSSLGQRFGSAAMRQTSDLLANLGAQTGARNAGILQSSFENAQNRALQGMGLQVQAGQALAGSNNQAAALLAQIAQANQQNNQWGQAFNQNNQNTFFGQQLQGIQSGFGMMNAQNDYNARLLALMAGQPMPQSGWSAVGGAVGDIGQLAAFYPMLQGLNRPAIGATAPARTSMIDPRLLAYLP